jgi:hypothetical protein
MSLPRLRELPNAAVRTRLQGWWMRSGIEGSGRTIRALLTTRYHQRWRKNSCIGPAHLPRELRAAKLGQKRQDGRVGLLPAPYDAQGASIGVEVPDRWTSAKGGAVRTGR